MSLKKHQSGRTVAAISPLSKNGTDRFAGARAFLKRHLIHTREIPNAKDYLFLGPEEEIHDALKLIVEIERESRRFLHIDFTRVDHYFLLRLVGPQGVQHAIATYFV